LTDATVVNENRAVAAVVQMVNDNEVAHLVDYISFSENICNELIKADPQNRVAPLTGGKTPEELKAAGYWGFDYDYHILKDHPEWIGLAKELGLATHVYTVDSAIDLELFIDLGVDFITTNNPLAMIDLLER
jgi:glycerophosphoryl diester phosphodiesterase